MKVKLVRQHNLKAHGFFKEHGGKIFEVLWQRDGGYDVDLAPICPGKRGFMYDDEVEMVSDSPTIRERLASVQHEIWSHWMKYLFSAGTLNQDGSFTIPADKVERWKRQMQTPYTLLSEKERDSDRELTSLLFRVLYY